MKRILFFGFIVFMLLPNDSFAQLKKDWGFWISDTTVDNRYYFNNTEAIVVDKEDNIYIQFTKDGLWFDTLFVRSYSSQGTLRWEHSIHSKDSSGSINAMNADFRYSAVGNEIQSHYLSKDSTGSHLMVTCFSPNGNVLREMNFIVSDSYDYKLKKSFWDKSGNYIVLNRKNSSCALVRIDSNGNVLEKNVDLEINHSFLSYPFNIENLDDDRFVFQYLTSKNTGAGSIFYVHLEILSKNDLSRLHTYSYAAVSDLTFPSHCKIKNNTIFLFGSEILMFDDNCQLIKKEEQIPSNVVSEIPDGFVFSYFNNSDFRVNKWGFEGEPIWYSQKTDSFLQNCTGLKYRNGSLITQGVSSFLLDGSPFPGSISRFDGVTNKRLNPSNGHILGEYRERFDTSRGDLYSSKFALDTKGSIINLAKFNFKGPKDNLNNIDTRTAYYLYKVCDDCDDIKSIANPDTNFIKIINNPTGNVLNYAFTIVTPDDLKFILTDISGNVLQCDAYKTFTPGYYQKTIDLSSLGLSKGHYFLTMQTAYNHYTTRFVYIR